MHAGTLSILYNWIVNDDAVNLTSELHDPNAQVNHLHKGRKKKT